MLVQVKGPFLAPECKPVYWNGLMGPGRKGSR